MYEFIQEERVVKTQDYTGLIRINDYRKVYWDIFVINLAIYNCFSIPFEISFEPMVMESVNFLIINSLIDFLFLTDIFVNFKTTHYDDISGDEISDKKVIAMTYLNGRFWIDLLSTIPFDNIVFALSGEEFMILPLLSLLKLIRVTRLSRIIENMNVNEQIKLMMKLA